MEGRFKTFCWQKSCFRLFCPRTSLGTPCACHHSGSVSYPDLCNCRQLSVHTNYSVYNARQEAREGYMHLKIDGAEKPGGSPKRRWGKSTAFFYGAIRTWERENPYPNADMFRMLYEFFGRCRIIVRVGGTSTRGSRRRVSRATSPRCSPTTVATRLISVGRPPTPRGSTASPLRG